MLNMGVAAVCVKLSRWSTSKLTKRTHPQLVLEPARLCSDCLQERQCHTHTNMSTINKNTSLKNEAQSDPWAPKCSLKITIPWGLLPQSTELNSWSCTVPLPNLWPATDEKVHNRCMLNRSGFELWIWGCPHFIPFLIKFGKCLGCSQNIIFWVTEANKKSNCNGQKECCKGQDFHIFLVNYYIQHVYLLTFTKSSAG